MITILSQPGIGQPLQTVDSATIYFELNSTSATQSNFKYLNKINVIGPNLSATQSYLYKVPPRPITGYGLFSGSDILKTYTSYTLNPFITNILWTPPCYVEYSTNFYEEYSPGKTFSDTFFSAGALGLTFSSQHGFLPGDVITIDKDNKVLNPQYDGTCSVVSVPNNFSLVTSKSFGASSTAEGGLITNVIKYSIPATGSNVWAFNGTRQYEEVNFTFNEYILTDPNSRLLTKFGGAQYRRVFITDDGTMGFQVATMSNNYYIDVITKDLNEVVIGGGTISATYSYGNSFDFPAYPNNLQSAGIFMAGVGYYDISVKNNIFGQVSGTYSFKIVDNCSPYQNFRIMFLNSLGKMDYFNFDYISRDNYNVERNEFKKTLDYEYTIGDRGQTILSQNVQRSFYLSSNWITEYESAYLKELIYSPEVYWINGGNLIPLIITDTQYEKKTYLKDKLFCIFINAKVAYREATQNQ